ncbi:MAG: TetR/AcrR family transcriptional regulator [Acidimicrobiales bacterium]|jgi:AcrR family transcriptional regulator
MTGTEERILQAALRVVCRRGVRYLTMAEVSEAAEVSRTTLYRYFATKEQLLDGVAAYDWQHFSEGLDKALAEAASGPERTRVLLDYAVGYINDHPARELTESEPGFVIDYLRTMSPAVEAMLLGHLEEELASAPPVVAGALSAQQVVDIMARLLATSWVLPARDRSHLVATMDWLLDASPSAP